MKIILTFSLLILTNTAFSQQVTEDIPFNYISVTDNDFVNRFSGGLGITPVPSNGITGGCLIAPNTVSWGNDNAIYCSKYRDSTSFSTSTRLSFKYDTSQVNTSNFDRAVSLFLRPSADFNHYIIASVTHDKKLQIVSYSWANSPSILPVIHNHWYELILNTYFTSGVPLYNINVSAMVNDLGTTGLTPPVPVGSSNGSFTDSVLFNDLAVQVSFTAALWGGAKYIDNFQFQGWKSTDSCVTTHIENINSIPAEIYFSDNSLTINSHLQNLTAEIFNLEGRKVFSVKVSPGISGYDLPAFNNGIYFIRLFGHNAVNISRKLLIVN
jgi:hypothetical protein